MKTVYHVNNTQVVEYKPKNCFKNLKTAISNNKITLSIAPRQSGKTIFLIDTILTSITDYDHIILFCANRMNIVGIQQNLKFNFDYNNIQNKTTNNAIELDGCTIHCNSSGVVNEEFMDKNVLVLFDEFMFNIKFNEQFKWAENLMYTNNVKIVGISTKTQNIHYDKIVSGGLTTTPYFIMPIYLSDVGDYEKLKKYTDMRLPLDEFV